MTLFKPKPKPEPAVIRIIERDPLRVTTAEWRGNKDLVSQARIALASKTVRQMLDCMRHNHVGKLVANPGLPAEVRSVQLGIAEGYSMALNDFEALGMFETPTEPLKADFAKENWED
jgi:16S rRNA A1518/A1519 N6-dimethyltransferase RsmA/KsgA/DIM1 with predicted DNA glycosylase/AP lyase activity